MDFSLKEKTAIVVGGSKGLGFGMATGLAQAGANVVLVSRNQGQQNVRKHSSRGRRQPGQQKFRQQLVCQLYKAPFWRSDPKIFHGYANLLGNSGSVHDSRRH